MIIPPFSIHERLRLVRRFAGLTQSEMAKALEMTQGWLSKLESGTGEVTVGHLHLLREKFGVSADAFLDGTIPYLEMAARMGSPAVASLMANTRWQSPRTRAFYGFFSYFLDQRGEKEFAAVLRRLKMPAHFLADPESPLPSSFLKSFFEMGFRDGVFSPRSVWSDVAKRQMNEVYLGRDLASLLRPKSMDDASQGLRAFYRLVGQEGQFKIESQGENLEFHSEVQEPQLGSALCRFNEAMLQNVFSRLNRPMDVRQVECAYQDSNSGKRCRYSINSVQNT